MLTILASIVIGQLQNPSNKVGQGNPPQPNPITKAQADAIYGVISRPGTLLFDSYEDVDTTTLVNHTTDNGSKWVLSNYETGSSAITSGKWHSTSTTAATFVQPLSRITDSVSLASTVYYNSQTTGTQYAGVIGYASKSAKTGYFAFYAGDSKAWYLAKIVGGTFTALGVASGIPANLGTGIGYRMRLDCRPGSQKLYVDGQLIITGTDTSIAPTNLVGTTMVGAFTDTTGLALDDFEAQSLSVPILSGSVDVFRSPSNCVSTGYGLNLLVPGAYARFRFSGSTSFRASVDVSQFTKVSAASSSYSVIGYAVDGGTLNKIQLTSSGGYPINLSGLSTKEHTVEISFTGSNDSIDRWNGDVSAVRFNGFWIDSSAQILPALRSNKWIAVFGDSITQGVAIDGAYGSFGDALGSWACLVPKGLGYERAQFGYPGQGYAVTGSGNVPVFEDPTTANSAWRFIRNGSYRFDLSSSSAILVNEGTNDGLNNVSDSTVTSRVTQNLNQLRISAPGVPIVQIVPFGRYKESAITAGYNAYQASTPDSLCFLIPGDATIANGINAATISSANANSFSIDGVHPNRAKNAAISTYVIGKLRALLGNRL